jgi:hypothetical protein
VLTAVLVVGTLSATHGHLVYALDDPYIHLALAENLAHGHYGINPSEPASPSSSLLWPYMLIPFAGTPLHVFLPLMWNVLFGSLAACLIGMIVAESRVATKPDQEHAAWQQYVIAFLLILIANLASLTLVGMEHVLQVLLAVSCAYGVIQVIRGNPVPVWCIAAAVVAPWVRYEDLSLTLALSCALIGVKRWRAAVVMFSASLVPLVAFSLFLRSRGMPLLPMSVLLKGEALIAGSPTQKLLRLLRLSLKDDFLRPDHYSTVLLFVIFVVLAIRAKTGSRRWAFAGAAILGLLQLTIGRFGWFHRYEVYALIFLVTVAVSIAKEFPWMRFAYIVVVLIGCASFYAAATAITPASSYGIYHQQYQMRRFLTEFYDKSYAVNDIGLTSFQRRPGTYVLDLYGLASEEAGRQQQKTAKWLDEIVRRHDIELAAIYPEWFEVPESWTAVGSLCVPTRMRLHLGSRCVVFYSTTPASVHPIEADLSRFSKELPPGSVYTDLVEQ